jgi:hypothetical protein
MNPVCHALKCFAESLWSDAKAVEKLHPERAEALRDLAKSKAREADEIANKSGTRRFQRMGRTPN